MEMKDHTGSVFGSLRHFTVRLDLTPGVYFNLPHTLGFEITVRLSDPDNFVMVVVLIVNELENMRQESCVRDDDFWPVQLKNSSE